MTPDSAAGSASSLGYSGTVVEFDVTGPRGRRVWLVLEPREVSVCVTPPRFDPDLVDRADLALFFCVWLGRVDYDTTSRSGAVVVDDQMPAYQA